MDYQVWIKDDYQDVYTKVDCGDIEAARREIETAIRAGKNPLLTNQVPYAVGITFEEGKIEATKDKAEPDKGARTKSNGKVRRGEEAVAEGLDKGSGDNLAGDSPGDRGGDSPG